MRPPAHPSRISRGRRIEEKLSKIISTVLDIYLNLCYNINRILWIGLYNLGRPTTEIDSESLFDFMESGMNLKEGASTLGVSIPTLRMRIAQLKSKEGLLQDFKTIRALRVTELTALILDSITEEKITEAPLGELVKAYKILREKEPDTDPAEAGKVEGGLLAYL